jgi:hypothetical protein
MNRHYFSFFSIPPAKVRALPAGRNTIFMVIPAQPGDFLRTEMLPQFHVRMYSRIKKRLLPEQFRLKPFTRISPHFKRIQNSKFNDFKIPSFRYAVY